MKKILTFISLAFVFSVSMAFAGTTVVSIWLGSAAISKLLPPEPGPMKRSPALINLTPVLITPQYRNVVPRFMPPLLEAERKLPSKVLPLIGWRNINCYGGTCAKYARG